MRDDITDAEEQRVVGGAEESELEGVVVPTDAVDVTVSEVSGRPSSDIDQLQSPDKTPIGSQ